MAKNTDYERQVRAMFEACGCSDAKPEVSKHMKWRFKTPAGNPGFVVTSRTPSDRRGILNLRSNVRAIIKEKDHG